MQQSNGWRRMVAWALVGVLMVVLWATPGLARKPKEEKPKPTEGEIAGLLVALEDEWLGVKGLVFGRLAEFDGQALRGTLKQPEVLAKKAFDILKDEKVAANVRGSAASALGNLGEASKPYVKDILAFLKDEKVAANVRGSAASALGNLGEAAKPYMRDWAKLSADLFLKSSSYGESDGTIVNTALLKLGGLKLSDSLPIVNAIYGNTPNLQEGRFLVKTATLGDKDTVTLLNWVGKPKTIPKKLTHEEAKTTLKIFQTAWDASTDLPELRNDLATQTREITNNRNITWQADDIPLLTNLATALKTSGYTSADIDNAIQSIALYKWGTTIIQTLLIHLTFWIALIFFYPKSPPNPSHLLLEPLGPQHRRTWLRQLPPHLDPVLARSTSPAISTRRPIEFP